MAVREPSESLDPRMLKVWRTNALWSGLAELLLPALAAAASWRWGWPWWIVVVLTASGLVELAVSTWVLPPLRWRNWRYEIRDEEIELRRGFIMVKRTLVPMVRIQHVDMKQGPVMRRFGVASIAFSTAAGEHVIPGLSLETAEAVRDRIMELARLIHEDA